MFLLRILIKHTAKPKFTSFIAKPTSRYRSDFNADMHNVTNLDVKKSGSHRTLLIMPGDLTALSEFKHNDVQL